MRVQRTRPLASLGSSPLARHPSGARGVFLLLLATVLLVACSATKPGEARPPTPKIGQVSYEAVTAADATSSTLVPEVDYIPAAPAPENTSPVYPQCLLNLGLPPQKVVMRILVDDQGQVTEVRGSAAPSEVDPAYRADFETAISEAVRDWQFTPAMRRAYVDSPELDSQGRPLYKVLKSVKPAPSYFDIRFIFEVRDGRAVVRNQ